MRFILVSNCFRARNNELYWFKTSDDIKLTILHMPQNDNKIFAPYFEPDVIKNNLANTITTKSQSVYEILM